MPLVSSAYKPSWPFKNGHFSTMYSAKLRPMPRLVQERERLILPDGDFLDVDWSFSSEDTSKLAVLLHGLEGNAQRTYIKGMGRVLVNNNWHVAAMNYRGCSGKPNTKFESYNAGKTDDLDVLISEILRKDAYDEIVLVGFSLGGNLLMKYLGEQDTLPKQIKKGVAISSPLDLKYSLQRLNGGDNWIYRMVFLNSMRKKFKEKATRFPDQLDMKHLKKVRSIRDFDDLYTAPAHGFLDALDYYEKNSSGKFIENIKTPLLLLNARNDSFLSEHCFPFELASHSKNIYLETPKYGGHVGFHLTNKNYYNELRTLEFLTANH